MGKTLAEMTNQHRSRNEIAREFDGWCPASIWFLSGAVLSGFMSAGGPGVLGTSWVIFGLAITLALSRMGSGQGVYVLSPPGMVACYIGSGLVVAGLIFSTINSGATSFDRILAVSLSYGFMFVLAFILIPFVPKRMIRSAMTRYVFGLVILASCSVFVYFVHYGNPPEK